jgi:hypothetical protein
MSTTSFRGPALPAQRRPHVRLNLEALDDRITPVTYITWDGGGNDNLWTNPLNWNTDIVPSGLTTIAKFDSLGLANPPTIPSGTTAPTIGGLETTSNWDKTITINGSLTVDGFLWTGSPPSWETAPSPVEGRSK